jgi:hypothetical protein
MIDCENVETARIDQVKMLISVITHHVDISHQLPSPIIDQFSSADGTIFRVSHNLYKFIEVCTY